MSNIRDLSGLRFGKLQIIKFIQVKPRMGSYFLCLCDCGVTKEIRGNSLSGGKSNSCGCESIKKLQLRTKHGFSGSYRKNGTPRSPEYHSWAKMKNRCLNSHDKNYKYYGALGVIVCDRWMSFPNFVADMGKRPANKSLDRIDPYGNYEPGNCRWATAKEQANNKRKKPILIGASHP